MSDELTARRQIPYVPACETGRHDLHPMETCDEYEAYCAHVRAYFERLLADAYAEVDRSFLADDGTGEPRGLLNWTPSDPTPLERALSILDADLRRCPLYDAGPPRV